MSDNPTPRTEPGEPTFDADGYPTEETLDRIKSWPIKVAADFAAVMDFAGRAWSYPRYWKCDPAFVDVDYPSYKRRRYVFSTGGWSGNEAIVSAIEANNMVQSIGAWSWRRGGHYEYRFPIDAEEPSDERYRRGTVR
jgi:hypothetical protein